jgi:hypothetical protein
MDTEYKCLFKALLSDLLGGESEVGMARRKVIVFLIVEKPP